MMNIKIKFNNLTLFFILISFLCGYIKNTLIILIIIILHELGHVLISLLLGFKIKEIEIFPFGGISKIDKLLNTKIWKDILISIGGILVQLIIFILCKMNIIKSNIVYQYNLYIMLFNLLPIIPLDGSKILFEIISLFNTYKNTIKLYIIISIIFIGIYIYFNYEYNLNNYLIVSLFIYKTFEIFRNRKIIYHKFILEKILYDNIEYSFIKYDILPINYYKDTKYYYNVNNIVLTDKEYLKKIYMN